jgi:hypothetical protein
MTQDAPVARPNSREALQEALIEQLILPTLPLVAEALRDMLGQRGKLRDLKAAYTIAEVARDLVLKGLSDGPTLRSVMELVEGVKKRLDELDAPPDDEAGETPQSESLVERARRASREGEANGHDAGGSGLAEVRPKATDDLGT